MIKEMALRCGAERSSPANPVRPLGPRASRRRGRGPRPANLRVARPGFPPPRRRGRSGQSGQPAGPAPAADGRVPGPRRRGDDGTRCRWVLWRYDFLQSRHVGFAVTSGPYATATGLVERSAAAYVAGIPDHPADEGFFGPGSVTWRV